MEKRRFCFPLLLIFVLVFVSTFISFAEIPFTDVNTNDWFYSGVQYVYENNLMNGTDASSFRPGSGVTRAMLVTVLNRLDGSPVIEKKCGFKDVRPGAYYENAVVWAENNKIVSGYNADSFGPDNLITREQMAVILFRYAVYKGYDVSDLADITNYNDYSLVSGYARTALSWANRLGLINGISAAELAPKGNATRAQTAVILKRFCEQFSSGNTTPVKVETTAKSNTSSGSGSRESLLGIESSKASASSDNLFLINAELSGDGSSVMLTLTLDGKVCLCGFDMKLLYDAACYSLKSLDTDCGLAVYSSVPEPGCISFNYSNAKNITKKKTILKAEFDVNGNCESASAFNLKPVEIIACDERYEVIPAEYCLTYSYAH